MHPINRRGFTLAELIVAIMLAGILGVAVVRALNSTTKLTRTQYARIDAQQSSMAAVYYLNSAVRELDASEGDILIAAADTLRYRSMRWTGISCTAPVASGSDLQIVIKNSQTFGGRANDILLDSLLVFNENVPTTRSDDVWLVAWPSAATASQNCTDGTAGTRHTFRVVGGNAGCLATCTLGSPIRGYQLEQLTLENDGAGAYWLGRRTMTLAGVWSGVEQLAGPLASNGFTLAYRDTLNASTAILASIATVSVAIRTRSQDITGANPGNVRDSLMTRIALRNNKRF